MNAHEKCQKKQRKDKDKDRTDSILACVVFFSIFHVHPLRMTGWKLALNIGIGIGRFDHAFEHRMLALHANRSFSSQEYQFSQFLQHSQCQTSKTEDHHITGIALSDINKRYTVGKVSPYALQTCTHFRSNYSVTRVIRQKVSHSPPLHTFHCQK